LRAAPNVRRSSASSAPSRAIVITPFTCNQLIAAIRTDSAGSSSSENPPFDASPAVFTCTSTSTGLCRWRPKSFAEFASRALSSA
jgi:hypothetical protein